MPRTRKGYGISTPRPAPGDLRRIQELLDTRNPATGEDALASPAALAAWLAGQGLIPAGAELTPADQKRVVAFREGLRALVVAGGRPKPETVERVNRTAAGARVEVRLRPDGAPRLEAGASSVDDALGRYLAIFVHAHADGTWSRLRLCVNPDCRRTFYDDSRTRARRWCTRHCGDAGRSRAFRKTERYKRGR